MHQLWGRAGGRGHAGCLESNCRIQHAPGVMTADVKGLSIRFKDHRCSLHQQACMSQSSIYSGRVFPRQQRLELLTHSFQHLSLWCTTNRGVCGTI